MAIKVLEEKGTATIATHAVNEERSKWKINRL